MAHLIRAYDLAQRRNVIDDEEVDDPASPRGDTGREPAAKRRRTALTDVRMQASEVSEGLAFNTSQRRLRSVVGVAVPGPKDPKAPTK